MSDQSELLPADYIPFSAREKVRKAIADPGSVVGDRPTFEGGQRETMDSWQARAAIKAFVDAQAERGTIARHRLSGEVTVEQVIAELEALSRTRHWESTGEDQERAVRLKVCRERRKRWPETDCDRDGSCDECASDMAMELETDASKQMRADFARLATKLRAAFSDPRRSVGEEREAGAKIIYEAMRWAADNAEKGKHPAWVAGGNATAQDEARRAFDRIAALSDPHRLSVEEVEVARIDQAVSRLCDLHRKMFQAVEQEKPYPVSIRLNDNDLEAVLYGALELEKAKAALSDPHRLSVGEVERAAFALAEAAGRLNTATDGNEALRSERSEVLKAMRALEAALSPTDRPDGEVERLRELGEKATQGEWRVGADLIRVHPHWTDDAGNASPECFHRNGHAKTIANVGKEDGDWRGIEQQVADAAFIVAAVNYVRAALSSAREG